MYDGRKHVCAEGPNIINMFSFSKAYGMMGWRVGYVSATHSCAQLAAAEGFKIAEQILHRLHLLILQGIHHDGGERGGRGMGYISATVVLIHSVVQLLHTMRVILSLLNQKWMLLDSTFMPHQ